MDVSKTIYSGDWFLFENKGRVHIQYNGDAPIVLYNGKQLTLSPANAREVWQVLNKWIERNAKEVEVDE